MIDLVTLSEVKMECNRVLACIRVVERECVKKTVDGKPFINEFEGNVHKAALKRASMDLTRALAGLRRRRKVSLCITPDVIRKLYGGMTRREFAPLLGLTLDQLYRIETGKREIRPSLALLVSELLAENRAQR